MSDSSSDENMELLREAVDTQFMPKSMFSTCSKENGSFQTIGSPQPKNKLPPSKRLKEDEETGFHDLGVTPGFQTYVAKHLEKIIDSQIKEVRRSSDASRKDDDDDSGGIRLLSSSAAYISTSDEAAVNNKHARRESVKKKWKHKDESSSSEDENQIALTADECALSKKGTVDRFSKEAEVIKLSSSEMRHSLCSRKRKKQCAIESEEEVTLVNGNDKSEFSSENSKNERDATKINSTKELEASASVKAKKKKKKNKRKVEETYDKCENILQTNEMRPVSMDDVNLKWKKKKKRE